MPFLTRRRLAGLCLIARLAGLAALPALALLLPAGGEVVEAFPHDPTGARTLVSHAGTAMMWEGSLSNILSRDNILEAIEALLSYSSGASSIGS